MQLLKIALCDDIHGVVQKYAGLLSEIAEKHHIDVQLSCFCSGESLIFHLSDGPAQADIIYLDIMMGQMDGMETARRLRDYGCSAQIVFLTSSEDYVFEAFDVHAVQYLVKEETSAEKFERVFLHAAERASKKEEELFLFEFDGKTRAIPFHQITHFEIWKRIVMVHYADGKTEKFYATLEQLEKRLSDRGFVRVHRSYLVALRSIAMLQRNRLQLKTGKMIPVGVTYMESVKSALFDYASRFYLYDSKDSGGEGNR